MSDSVTADLGQRDEPNIPEEGAAPQAGWGGSWRPLFRYVPALDSLRQYSWPTLRADALAGLTVAAVAVPQAMAYALIAGIPPEHGLYTAIVMTVVGALFCSSKQLINGPTNAISIAVLSALAPIHDEASKIQAAILLALLVGIIQTGITLFRLGDLTRYISNAVIVGFTLGAAVLLVLDQTKNLVGLTPRGGPEDHFLKRFWLTITESDRLPPWTVGIGLGTIVLVLGLRWLDNRLRIRLLPEFLLVVIGMATLVWAADLRPPDVQVIPEIPRALPAFSVPTFDPSHLRHLSSSALAIALLGLLEALAMAKALAAQTGQKLDINQQCLSEGLANLSGSFFQCYPGSGSLTRSAINQQSGGLTQWAGIFCALAVAATMLLFAPLARYIPRAALAGILMVSAWRMVDRKQLLYHLRATKFDAGIVLATAFAAVFISVEFCILVGVFLSFLLYVPRAARIHMSELTLTPERVVRERRPQDPRCARILMYSIEGELFFGAAPDFDRHLAAIERRADAETRVVVLRLKRARNPDGVCLALLDDFLARMRARNIVVLLCGVREDLARALHNTGLLARLPPEHVFREQPAVGSSTLAAVRYAYDLLAGDLCSICPRRREPNGEQQGWYYMI
jgi:SulP family sulfate permease